MSQTNGTIIILDIGRNVSCPEEKNEESFFKKGRECAAKIIERKILIGGNNVISIMLLGSKKTDNNLANTYKGAFRRIVTSDFKTPSWQMIRELPEEPSSSQGDWFDALVLAADQYQNPLQSNTTHYKWASKKIILMTNFQNPSNFDPNSVEEVINEFKNNNYEVDIIGPDLYADNYDKNSIELARQFVEITDGATETFDNTMRYLLFHKKRAVKAMPWNVDLSIGPNIKIPVSAYLRNKEEPAIKKWEKAVKDPVTNTASTYEAVVKTKEYVNPNNEKVEGSEEGFSFLTKGYHYGQKIIPFNETDETALYKSGDKCLSVYGFTSAKNIQWQCLNGDSLQYVFGRKGDVNAQNTIRCLVECLHELDLVGVVRKVHNNNNAPKMFALFPVIDPTNNFVCLSMVALCYKEEIKLMSFPSTNLKKYNCTDEQVNAFKDLINAMDLTKAYDSYDDDAEAFPVAECVSPSDQYILDCIAFRAMNPGKPLPPPRDEIKCLFEVPPLIAKNVKDPLDKIKQLFVLKKVEPKPKRNKNIDMDIDLLQPANGPSDNQGADTNIPKVQLPGSKAAVTVTSISTIDPIHDFKALKNQDKTLTELGPEMIKTVENLINCNVDGNFSKAIEAMKHLRSEYVTSDPTDYNKWIQKLKIELGDKKNVLDLIIENKASFILKEENDQSTYETENSHAESQLYENDTIPQSIELSISSEVQNMFDD